MATKRILTSAFFIAGVTLALLEVACSIQSASPERGQQMEALREENKRREAESAAAQHQRTEEYQRRIADPGSLSTLESDAEIEALRSASSFRRMSAAEKLGDAKGSRAVNALIAALRTEKDAAAFTALTRFVERFAIPVVQHRPRYLSLPSSHPMNLGFAPADLVATADVIMVLEADVPWIPSRVAPAADCKVIQCGLDPLFARYPIRGFPCDLAITGGTAAIISALTAALEDTVDSESVARRRRAVKDERDALTASRQRALEAGARKTPLDPAWVSHCIDRAKDPHSIVINEYTLFPEHCSFDLADPGAGERAYAAGHIPGAHYLHLERDLSGPKTGKNGRHPLPERAALVDTLAANGLMRNQQVVGRCPVIAKTSRCLIIIVS